MCPGCRTFYYVQRNKYSEVFTFKNATILFLLSFFIRLLFLRQCPPLHITFILKKKKNNCIYHQSLLPSGPSFQTSLPKVPFLQIMPLHENHPGVSHCPHKVQSPQFGIDPDLSYLSNFIFHFSFTHNYFFSQIGIIHGQQPTPLVTPLPCLSHTTASPGLSSLSA